MGTSCVPNVSTLQRAFLPVTKRTQTSRKKPDLPSQIIDAALTLAEREGWGHLCVADIAVAAGVPMSEALTLFPTKEAILVAFQDRIDRTVVADTQRSSLDGGMRDRLFDVLIRRLEALTPWKEGIAAIGSDILKDPLASFCGLTSLSNSMSLMAECAGLSSSGLRGRVRIRGLTVIYLFALRRWLNDDSSDMGATMAELDKRLKTAEQLWQRFPFRATGNRKKNQNED